MNSNQKEILERVLLMMKYDSSRTLNENFKVIIEQSMGGGFTPQNQGDEITQTIQDTKNNKWLPKLKSVKPFFGESIDIPENSETVIGWPGYDKFKDNKTFPIQGSDEYGPFMFGYKLKEIPYYSKLSNQIPDDSKIHFPSTNAMENLFNGAVYQFTIPKGTMIPFDENVKENEDDWLSSRQQGERPVDKDITFKATKTLKKENVNQSIVPIDKNGMNGWEYYPAYYTNDLDEGKFVSYVPELWIQYKSPSKIWWDEYGLWIELVGSVLISILASALTPVIMGAIGASSISVATMSFYADLVINGIFNLAIAKMHFDFHDEEQGWFSIIFSFLPLIHRYGGAAIQSVFKGISEEAIKKASQEVLSKSSGIVLDTPQQWKSWYNSLSKETREVVKSTSKIQQSQIEPAMKTILTDVNKKILENKAKNPKWFIQSSISSGAKGLVKFIGRVSLDFAIVESLFKSVESIIGKKLSNEQKVNIISYSINTYDTNDVNNALRIAEEKIKTGELTDQQVIDITKMGVIPEAQIDSIVNLFKEQDKNMVSLFD